MDKLRAIRYFNRAVEAGSFAAAARSLDVTTPAVSQMIAMLERAVGARLLDRSPHGLALTPDGVRYYTVSQTLTASLDDVERELAQRSVRARGALTVGMRAAIGQTCVMPRLRRFRERFPDVELDFRLVETIDGVRTGNVDVAVMIGWPPEGDFAIRALAQTRNVVCASPDYWSRNEPPREPEALRGHECLVYRSAGGTMLDRWTFERNGERRAVDVCTRVMSDHRSWLDQAACAGAGVVRMADITLAPYVAAGQLVPALEDWEGVDAPPIFAAYRAGQRPSKVVRVFVDFLVEIFAEIARERDAHPHARVPANPRPEWFGRAQGRHSAYAARRVATRARPV